MTETITIVGASVRAAAQSALRAGYAPLAVDMFADADLARLCTATRVADYPDEFARALCGGQSGGWMYTGGLENHPRLVDRWSQVRRLWGNCGAALRAARDPTQVAAALAAAGLACPAIAADRSRLTADRRWLEKSLTSTGGSGVAFAAEAGFALASASDRPGAYYQEYVPGESCSAVFVACRGRAMLLGATRQLIGADWLGAGGFRYCGSIGPLALKPGVTDQLRRIGDALAAVFDLAGLFGVDAVLHDEVAWPVEINPRYTASVEVLERAGGWSAIAHHMLACRDGRLPDASVANEPLAPSATYGKAIVFARRPLVVSPKTSAAWLERACGERADLADVPGPGTRIAPGEPIATLLAAGAGAEDALARLRSAAEEFDNGL